MTLTKELKIALITIAVLTIICGTLLVLYIQNRSDISNPLASEVRGDQDQIIIEEEREFQPLKPAPNKEEQVKTTSPFDKTIQSSENYSLSGNGCDSNREYPNTCNLTTKEGNLLTNLKDCNIETEELKTCNVYIYSLGREDNNGIYIFQSFEEENQELTDVFFYNNTTQEYNLVDTVLYENFNEYQSINVQDFDVDPNSLQNKVDQNNQNYLETINQYQ